LRSIDTLWIEHLNAMDILREGIGLRGYGQRDPLVEYKAEAYNLFQRLIQNIEAQAVEILLKADITPAKSRPLSIERPKNLQMQGADENLAAGTFESDQSNGSGESIGEPLESEPVKSATSAVSATSSVSSAFGKVGRNDPCPCGSGKKFKKCHGK